MGLTASMRRSLRRVGVWGSPRLDLGLSQFTSTSFEKKKSTEKKIFYEHDGFSVCRVHEH